MAMRNPFLATDLARLTRTDCSSENRRATRSWLPSLSAFEESGELAAAFSSPPVYVPRYQGGPEDLGAQAEFLYRSRRHLTLDALREFRQELGIADLNEPLHTRLISAGWCFDSGQWLPARDYYTGSLWSRYDRGQGACGSRR